MNGCLSPLIRISVQHYDRATTTNDRRSGKIKKRSEPGRLDLGDLVASEILAKKVAQIWMVWVVGATDSSGSVTCRRWEMMSQMGNRSQKKGHEEEAQE